MIGPWTHPDTYRETAEARVSHVHLCKIVGDCGVFIVRSEWIEPT